MATLTEMAKRKLIEHFVSGIDNKETNKFYEGLTDYEQLIELTVKKINFICSIRQQTY